MTVVERWAPVLGFEGWYEASDQGRVRRITTRGRELKPQRDTTDYLKLVLYRASVASPRSIHRIIAGAFLGACPAGLVVNHRNGVKTDNRLENLEYVTQGENNRHAYATGLRAPTREDPTRATCLHGHAYDTRRRKDGHRYCSTCNRDRLWALRATGYIPPNRRKA